MANNSFISTSDLDFDSYRNNLVTYLKNQAIFQDYNFDGSNISVLLDILSYNTTLNAFYLNMVGSEMFLDTSQLRESAVSHAKELNYIPRSRSSAHATVTINANPGDASASVVIPKYFRFSTTINGNPYIFATDEALTVTSTNNYSITNINLYEGRVLSEYINKNTVDTRFILSSANVDTSSVEVSVYATSTSATANSYTLATNLYGLNANSQVFFVQGYGNNQYEVVFGNGTTGRQVQIPNLIKVTYRDTSGLDGNDASAFTAVDNLVNSSSTNFQPTVTVTASSSGGSEREDISSIKFNAPRFYATQDRAVTKQDYISLVKSNFPSVQAVAVYGGEELISPDYGSVYLSIKPYFTTLISDTLKNDILNYLSDRTVLSITPKIVDPDYFYIDVVTSVFYDPTNTTLNINDITSLVRTSISSFSATNLSDFSSNFRYSKFISSIDNADNSIEGNDTTTRMIKRIAPTSTVSTNFTIDFNNVLNTNLKSSTIISNSFTYTLNSIDYTAYLKDDGNGIIVVINQLNDATIDTVGTINYTTGELALNNFTVTNYTNYISIYANIFNNDITLTTNQILNIEQTDVTITVSTTQ